MCARCLIALDPPPLSVAGEVQSGSCLIAARAVLAALREVAGL